MAVPSWPGADACYSRAYRVLDALAKAGHVKRVKRGRHMTCEPSEDMNELIDALNRGDEERIKGLLLQYRTRGVTDER